MLSTGMSYRRFMRPYLLSAAVIAVATYVLSAYIIPPANVERINYTNTYVKINVLTMERTFRCRCQRAKSRT